MIGQRVGHYEIVEEIAQGGMATVYRAYDSRTKRFVALKIIDRNIARDPRDLERFRHEAELISRLEHPHLIPVYDYSADHDPPYIVMRYLDGASLKEILESGTRLPVSEIAHLMRQVCSALDYAHRRNIIHRDIKPGNIMVDQDGNAYLTDFGIARVTTAPGITQSGIVVGTPGYMSPEQAHGLENVDLRADIYALGVIIFEMAAGSAPFYASTPMSLLLKHIHDPIPLARDVSADIPPELDAIIQKAMAKEPQDRYGSAKELADALVTVAGSQAVTETPYNLKAAATLVMQRAESRRDDGAIQALLAKFERERTGVASAPETVVTPAYQAATQVNQPAMTAPAAPVVAPVQPAYASARPPDAAPAPQHRPQRSGGGIVTPVLIGVVVLMLVVIAGGIFLLLPAAPKATPTVNATRAAEQTAVAGAPTLSQPTRTPVGFVPTALPDSAVTPLPDTQETPIPGSAFDLASRPVASNADWTNAYPQGYEQEFDGVDMVLVPAGCFNMGNDPQGYHWNGSEYVPVVPSGGQQCFDAPFWLDKYEVSNEQFTRLNGRAANPGAWNSPQRPRETVSWFEARDFCAERGARLPTEREWEYAARGPDGLFYPWGNTFVPENTVYESNANGQTADIGTHPGGKSWVGAMDMGGNVFEWVGSWFAPYPYQAGDGREDLGDSAPQYRDRILRGGGWGNIDLGVRAAGRGGLTPDQVTHFGGFRCATGLTVG